MTADTAALSLTVNGDINYGAGAGATGLRIALCGKRYAGKGLAADYLVGVFKFWRMAFADPFKDDIVDLVRKYKPEVDRAYCDARKELFRTTWQSYANDLMKPLCGEDVWTKIAVGRAAEHRLVVADDMRMRVEEEAWHAMGGIVVRITATDKVRRARGDAKAVASGGRRITDREWAAHGEHRSETEVDELHADFEVGNNGSVALLNTTMLFLVATCRDMGYPL